MWHYMERKVGRGQIIQAPLRNDKEFELYPEADGKPLKSFKQSAIMIKCVIWKDGPGYLKDGEWHGV